jgi:tetratricopeptide (TPR) repeat protein
MPEYLEVEKPFLDQLAGLGWEVIDHGGGGVPADPARSLRGSSRQWLLLRCLPRRFRPSTPRRPVSHPQNAIRHYEVGMRIGELSLGNDFADVLQWGHSDNRPFLRCIHGYGLCLWRLGRFDEAIGVFDRMLWMNPSDNQGVRFLIDEVRAKTAWEDSDNA